MMDYSVTGIVNPLDVNPLDVNPLDVNPLDVNEDADTPTALIVFPAGWTNLADDEDDSENEFDELSLDWLLLE